MLVLLPEGLMCQRIVLDILQEPGMEPAVFRLVMRGVDLLNGKAVEFVKSSPPHRYEFAVPMEAAGRVVDIASRRGSEPGLIVIAAIGVALGWHLADAIEVRESEALACRVPPRQIKETSRQQAQKSKFQPSA